MAKSKPKMKYVEVKIRRYQIPSNVGGFFEFLESEIAKQPVPRDEISISIEEDTEWGESYAYLVLAYWRPETEEERQTRLNRDRGVMEARRRQYEQLRKEFEKEKK